MKKETIFNTSLKRLENLDNVIYSKEFKKKTQFEKHSLYQLRDRLELIAAEMWYRRKIEPLVVKYVRENYIDMKDIDSSIFMQFSLYEFCEDLFSEHHLLIQKKDFDRFVNKTVQKEIKNIENKNLKLF